jgi:serine/threonine-protein kinase RsbT
MDAPLRLTIQSQTDVEHARRQTQRVGLAAGFTRVEAEMVVLAVSELATNLLRYARTGHIMIEPLVGDTGRLGLRVESSDRGPGIADVDRALQDGFSTGGGLGSGLPAVRRLMDDVMIESNPTGTRIVACKWLPNR